MDYKNYIKWNTCCYTYSLSASFSRRQGSNLQSLTHPPPKKNLFQIKTIVISNIALLFPPQNIKFSDSNTLHSLYQIINKLQSVKINIVNKILPSVRLHFFPQTSQQVCQQWQNLGHKPIYQKQKIHYNVHKFIK